MHPRDLVDLAGVLATQSSAILLWGHGPETSAVEKYWVLLKCLLDRWGRRLRELRASAEPMQPGTASSGTAASSDPLAALIEEILLVEIFVRVWAALVRELDRRCPPHDGAALVENVVQHLAEIRLRALEPLSTGVGLTEAAACSANGLRSSTERWTDLLLAFLAVECDVADLAHSSDRLRQFADDLREEQAAAVEQPVRALTLAALRGAFEKASSGGTENGDLHEQIAEAGLAALPPALFDGDGTPRSAWLMRLMHVTDERWGPLSRLWACDERRRAARRLDSRGRW